MQPTYDYTLPYPDDEWCELMEPGEIPDMWPDRHFLVENDNGYYYCGLLLANLNQTQHRSEARVFSTADIRRCIDNGWEDQRVFHLLPILTPATPIQANDSPGRKLFLLLQRCRPVTEQLTRETLGAKMKSLNERLTISAIECSSYSGNFYQADVVIAWALFNGDLEICTVQEIIQYQALQRAIDTRLTALNNAVQNKCTAVIEHSVKNVTGGRF